MTRPLFLAALALSSLITVSAATVSSAGTRPWTSDDILAPAAQAKAGAARARTGERSATVVR